MIQRLIDVNFAYPHNIPEGRPATPNEKGERFGEIKRETSSHYMLIASASLSSEILKK